MDQRFRTLFDKMPAAVVIQDVGLDRFVDANARAAALFRMSRQELLEQSFCRVSAPGSGFADADKLAEAIRSASAGRSLVADWACKGSQGFAIPCELRLFRFPAETASLVCGIITDQRPSRALHERLRRCREQLRGATRQIDDSIEEERSRLSRELHDQLGQLMTAAKINVAGIRRSAEKLPEGHGLRDELLERTTMASDVIDQMLNTVRAISEDLRPEGLDTLGFAAAVAADLEVFESRTGIRTLADIDPEIDSLPKKISTVLFRCMHELLTNVARHAQANRVDVNLKYREGRATLDLADDGVGLGDFERRRSLGLIGIDERVAELGGAVSFEAARRGDDTPGTSVRIEIPIRG